MSLLSVLWLAGALALPVIPTNVVNLAEFGGPGDGKLSGRPPGGGKSAVPVRNHAACAPVGETAVYTSP